MNILVADDEKNLVKGLKSSLEHEGYSVLTAYDGEQVLNCFENNHIDLLILDIMLPKIDGMLVCKTIRQKYSTPILMLTAKGGDYDKILAFELGADDYITKPFNTMELLLRVKAILRRSNGQKENKAYKIENLEIYPDEKSVLLDGQEVDLTLKEYMILELLIQNKGRVLSREQLYENVWNQEAYDVRTVDVHIKNIREKIEDDPKNPKFILTKRGIGYYFRKD